MGTCCNADSFWIIYRLVIVEVIVFVVVAISKVFVLVGTFDDK